jgi:hypothetical protein
LLGARGERGEQGIVVAPGRGEQAGGSVGASGGDEGGRERQRGEVDVDAELARRGHAAGVDQEAVRHVHHRPGMRRERASFGN